MVARRTVSRRQLAVVPGGGGETTYPNQSDPSTPGEPGFGRPLEYVSDLAPWRSPEYVAGQPMRAPGIARSGMSPLIGAGLAGNPPMPALSASMAVLDPHHYARLVSGILTPVAITPVQTPFMLSPASLRNFLMLRNGHATANIYIDFDTSASINSPLKIAPGQTYLWDEVVPQNDIYAFADAAGVTLSYAFGNIAGVAPFSP